MPAKQGYARLKKESLQFASMAAVSARQRLDMYLSQHCLLCYSCPEICGFIFIRLSFVFNKYGHIIIYVDIFKCRYRFVIIRRKCIVGVHSNEWPEY